MTKLIQIAIAKAGHDVHALLLEHAEAIADDIRRTIVEADSAKPIKYRVGLAVVLNPTGTECGVACKIRYGTAHTDDSEASVTLDTELPGMDKDGAA